MKAPFDKVPEEEIPAIWVVCTLCGARAGVMCHDERGNLNEMLHIARVMAWKRIKERGEM